MGVAEPMVTVLSNTPRNTPSAPNAAAVGLAPHMKVEVAKATVAMSLTLAARNLMVARVNVAVGSPPVSRPAEYLITPIELSAVFASTTLKEPVLACIWTPDSPGSLSTT
jgi:hypothetical protein